MMNVALPRTLVLAVAAGVALSGCVRTTGGSAVVPPGASTGPTVQPLQETGLDGVLLNVDEIGSIVDASGLEIAVSSEDLEDSSEWVDNHDCTTAMYGAQNRTYDDSDWKALRDQVIREPATSKKHWVEQTVVMFKTAEAATSLFEKAREQWKDCEQVAIHTTSSSSGHDWRIGDVQAASDTLTTLGMDQTDSDDWGCQHAMGVVSNVVVEGIACGHNVGSEGEQIVNQIVKNAEDS
jgi:hypothetical protein